MKIEKSCKKCGHRPYSDGPCRSYINGNGYCSYCIQEGVSSDETRDEFKRKMENRQYQVELSEYHEKFENDYNNDF